MALVYSGNPLTGTANDDFILDYAFNSPDNTLDGQDRDDLLIADFVDLLKGRVVGADAAGRVMALGLNRGRLVRLRGEIGVDRPQKRHGDRRPSVREKGGSGVLIIYRNYATINWGRQRWVASARIKD